MGGKNLNHGQSQILLDLTLSISEYGDLPSRLGRTLQIWLKRLDCQAGVVFTNPPDAGKEYVEILCTPQGLRLQSEFSEITWLLGNNPRVFPGQSQIIALSPENQQAGDKPNIPVFGHFLALPDFGIMVLVRHRSRLPQKLLTGLHPILARLAQACRVETNRLAPDENDPAHLESEAKNNILFENRVQKGFYMQADGIITPRQKAEEDLRSSQEQAVTSIEITELKKARLELEQLNRTLEERVAERTAEVEDLYNKAPLGFHSLDPNGIYLPINDTELDMLGYSREEIIGKVRAVDLMTESGKKGFQDAFPSFLKQGWLKDVELEFKRKDGTTLWVTLSATSVRDSAGRLLMSRSTIQDITDRRRVELEQARLLAILETTNDLVSSSDLYQNILYINKGGRALLGIGEKADILTVKDLFPGWAYQRYLNEALPAALLRGLWIGETALLHRDGNEIPASQVVIAHRNPEGKVLYISTIIRDIHDQKQAEEELRRRANELSLLNAELSQTTRMKDEFLANMSHELRTPLNAILGFAEMLEDGLAGPVTERQIQYVGTIIESGQHLLSLINDILDLSKVEAGKTDYQIETIALEPICLASLQLIQQDADKKSIQISFFKDPNVDCIQADERRLKQILVNLLTNAVKFTPDGGQVSLKVFAQPEQATIHLEVSDTGVGIAQENIQYLFKPFSQIDSSLSRQYNGTGLGLALAARLAEQHGGSVQVESDGIPGLGSRFTVILPWQPDAALSTSKSGTLPSQNPERASRLVSLFNPGAPLVLVAEDNEINLQLMLEVLQSNGLAVEMARNGQEALERARQSFPDLILMDIQMPDMDGLQAIRSIRQNPYLAHIPVIALTALAMPGDRELCLESGANAYLQKPVNLKELLKIIQGFLDR